MTNSDFNNDAVVVLLAIYLYCICFLINNLEIKQAHMPRTSCL